MSASHKTYSELQARLDEILQLLQDPEISVDRALGLHKEGGEVLKKLQDYLEKAKNEIRSHSVA